MASKQHVGLFIVTCGLVLGLLGCGESKPPAGAPKTAPSDPTIDMGQETKPEGAAAPAANP